MDSVLKGYTHPRTLQHILETKAGVQPLSPVCYPVGFHGRERKEGSGQRAKGLFFIFLLLRFCVVEDAEATAIYDRWRQTHQWLWFYGVRLYVVRVLGGEE